MSESLAEFAARRLQEMGRGAFEVARNHRLERTFVRDIVIGKKKSVQASNLPKLAAALETTPETIAAILAGRGARPTTPAPPATVAPADISLPEAAAMARDVPIFATALAGDGKGGFAIDRRAAADHVRRAPGLAGASSAYGFYVVDDSQAPLHSPGDLRFAHPHKPARPGDSILVFLDRGDDPPRVLLKTLVRRTAEKLVVGQINPKGTIELTLKNVLAIHRVLTTNELFEM